MTASIAESQVQYSCGISRTVLLLYLLTYKEGFWEKWFYTNCWPRLKIKSMQNIPGVLQQMPLAKKFNLRLPWWRSGWESACQCRRHGFEPWSGRIPHATEQLGPWDTITESVRLEPVLRDRRGLHTVMKGGPCTAMKSGPHLPQLEKALAQKRRPNTAKNKLKKKKSLKEKKKNKFNLI